VSITVGGALVGLVLCAIVIWPWWRKSGGGGKGGGFKESATAAGRNWKQLLPFLGALALGIVLAVSVGGLIGGAATKVRTGSDQLGDDSLHTLTGASGETVTHSGLAHLQAGAAVVVLILLTVVVLTFRKGSKAMKRDLGFGLIAGTTLGPYAAATGLATAILLPLVNAAGAHIMGWL
jgi:hypothetical protein